MTLVNCRRLLTHYEKVGNKEAAEEMRSHIVLKGGADNKPVLDKPVVKKKVVS